MKKIDFHIHIESDVPVEVSAGYLEDMCDRHGYCGVCAMSFTYGVSEKEPYFEKCNEKAMELKLRMKDSYAFANPLVGKDFAKQTEQLMNDGFDGIKLLRGGKPDYVKKYGDTYDSEVYADFFALCEEKQYPILMHNNDPAYCWDKTKASPRAIKMGWVYDESHSTHKRLYESAETVLKKYPRLNIALAHFGFYSENIDRAFELMEAYPNLKMDITPALNIYKELSAVHDKAEEFFRKYNDRLIFGTDAVNVLEGEDRAYNDLKNAVTTHFLTGEGERDIQGRCTRAISLTEEMLENIYYKNAMRFIGKL